MPPSPKAAPYEHITVATVNNPVPRDETVFVANVPVDEHKGALKGLNEYLDTLKDVSCTEKDQDVFSDLLELAKEYNNIAKAGGAPTTKDPMADLRASMEEAKRTGTVGSRNKAAWKFDRDADAETKNLLKGRTWTQKDAIKLEWNNSSLEDMKTSKVYENSWEQVDVTEGHYRTFGAIVVALGGWEWPEAIAGAKELVARSPWRNLAHGRQFRKTAFVLPSRARAPGAVQT